VGVRELTRLADVSAAAGGDPLVHWFAQGLAPGVRAWAAGDAVAVACPALSRYNRLAMHGSPGHAAVVLRHALAEVGPSYRPIGDDPLIGSLVATVPGLALVDRFDWMDTTMPVGHHGRAGWLAGTDLADVDRLLDLAFPTSYARPGRPGVRRWAGVRDPAGPLVATAADAWSAPGAGFLAGVATHPDARGRGYARDACALVVDALVAQHGRAALLVDRCNSAAIAVYRRLGLRTRPLADARAVTTP
jgi:hypothetical protein